MIRIDARQLQQKRLTLLSERHERGGSPAALQRRIVQAHDNGRQRCGILHVGERVQSGGSDVRVRIIERGDDLAVWF